MMARPSRDPPVPEAATAPAEFPSASGDLTLQGGAGAIEAQIELPDPDQARAGVVIVCHPHPLHEGTMHNKVVTMVVRSLAELGVAALRFNFRGVGASEAATTTVAAKPRTSRPWRPGWPRSGRATSCGWPASRSAPMSPPGPPRPCPCAS
jgi:hypothetical protein